MVVRSNGVENRPFPVLENFPFPGGYNVTKYTHRNVKPEFIPFGDKSKILYALFRSITNSYSQLPQIKREKKDENVLMDETLGLLSYPLFDLFSDKGRKCNWYVFEDSDTNDVSAVVLDYLGEHNYRQFFYGTKKAINTIVRNYHQMGLYDPIAFSGHPKDFRPVIPNYLFTAEDIYNLTKKHWKNNRKIPPQLITRMKRELFIGDEKLELPNPESYRGESFDLPHDNIPKGWVFREFDTNPDSNDWEAIEELYESKNYDKFSRNSKMKYYGLIDNRGNIISVSATLGEVPISIGNGIVRRIILTGNSATRSGYEGKGYASAVRKYNIQQLQTQYTEGIIVSDTIPAGATICLNNGYKPIASFYWCRLIEKDGDSNGL